jgi:plasmid stabilization system protein ParE
MNIRLLNLAQQEVDDAVRWYNEQTEGVGRDFLDELDRAIRLVKSHPLAATEIESGIRRCLLARFPYALIYGIDQQMIVIIAVAHLHRQPGYWADRIGK